MLRTGERDSTAIKYFPQVAGIGEFCPLPHATTRTMKAEISGEDGRL